MMIHTGTQSLQPDRLILRPLIIQDAPAKFQNWASDPDVCRYLTWPCHTSPDVSRMVLTDWVREYEKDNFYQWAIVLKSSGQPIGSISGLHPNDLTQSVEIGYCIGKPWWHQGIMAEALGAVIAYLIEEVGFSRVYARHDPNNPNSGAVMRKCGMIYEGTHRQADWNNSGICDSAYYAILACEHRNRTSSKEK